MKLKLGNSRSLRRRFDDVRCLPGDLVRRARAARERGLAAWAGYSVGQRLSSVGLSAAVVIALAVVLTGGGPAQNSDVVVAKDLTDRPVGQVVSDHPSRDTVDRPPVTPVESVAAAPSELPVTPAPIDTAAVLTDVAGGVNIDTKAVGRKVFDPTTTPAKNSKNPKVAADNAKVVANSSPLATWFRAALRSAPAAPSTATPFPIPSDPGPAAASPANLPSPTRPPATVSPTIRPLFTLPPTTRAPVTEPPTTRPPATNPPTTRPPTTRPPVTLPPTTRPPVTEPPTTRPPVTDPPTTRPPVTDPPTTRPPATDPPTTRPPVTEPPTTRPPVTEPPTTAPPVIERPLLERLFFPEP